MDLRLDPDRLVSMHEPLSPERVRQSPMHGRAIFILATRESGADLLLRSLGRLPGVAAAPVGTHVFSQGIDYASRCWRVGPGVAPEGVQPLTQGLENFVASQDFLGALRLLADAPLESLRAATGAERIVEYSFGHIHFGGLIADLYPDAHLVHLVRDGRQVVTRMVTTPIRWSRRDAVNSWIEDQAALVADSPPMHSVRLEDLHADPIRSLSDLAKLLEIPATDEAIQHAAACFNAAGREPVLDPNATALLEVLAPDLLERFGYALGAPTRAHRTARVGLALESFGQFVGRNTQRAYDRVVAWTEDAR
jgi:hypothetical protein